MKTIEEGSLVRIPINKSENLQACPKALAFTLCILSLFDNIVFSNTNIQVLQSGLIIVSCFLFGTQSTRVILTAIKKYPKAMIGTFVAAFIVFFGTMSLPFLWPDNPLIPMALLEEINLESLVFFPLFAGLMWSFPLDIYTKYFIDTASKTLIIRNPILYSDITTVERYSAHEIERFSVIAETREKGKSYSLEVVTDKKTDKFFLSNQKEDCWLMALYLLKYLEKPILTEGREITSDDLLKSVADRDWTYIQTDPVYVQGPLSVQRDQIFIIGVITLILLLFNLLIFDLLFNDYFLIIIQVEVIVGFAPICWIAFNAENEEKSALLFKVPELSLHEDGIQLSFRDVLGRKQENFWPAWGISGIKVEEHRERGRTVDYQIVAELIFGQIELVHLKSRDDAHRYH